jgi:hypothetical protein
VVRNSNEGNSNSPIKPKASPDSFIVTERYSCVE